MKIARWSALLVLAAAPEALAVESGRLGLSLKVGSTSAIGATCHVSQRLALRPSFVLHRRTAENTAILLDPSEEVFVFETTRTLVGGGVDVVWYFTPGETFTPYLGGGAAYFHDNQPYQATADLIRHGNLRSLAASALAGFQYAFHPRLHAYGEVGMSYVLDQRFAFGGRKLKSSTFGTMGSGIGVVFYPF